MGVPSVEFSSPVGLGDWMGLELLVHQCHDSVGASGSDPEPPLPGQSRETCSYTNSVLDFMFLSFSSDVVDPFH